MVEKDGSGALTPGDALGLLNRARYYPERVRELARQASGSVEPLDPKGYNLPAEAVPYHVDAERLQGEAARLTCRLLREAKRHNGVFLREGNPGYLCSHPDCGLDACPFAVAACIAACEGAAVLPVADETGDGPAEGYVRRWSELTRDSQRAINLIASPSENDFAGMVIADDDYYLQDFIDETADVLHALGKVETEEPKRYTLIEFINQSLKMTDRNSSFPTRQLILIDHLELASLRASDKQYIHYMREAAERLSHIIDDAYVILVGTDVDVNYLLDQQNTLKQTFGGHGIRLRGMGAEEVYRIYLRHLDAPLKREADGAFKRRFIDYVSDNIDQLPFRGPELADYLAKHANAEGSLGLPELPYEGDVEDLLEKVVGLEQVKAAIHKMEVEERWRVRYEGPDGGREVSHHMLFMGNPGTGKTMVARLVARLLHKIGVTRTGTFVEASPRDLIGMYIGHTDKRVHQKILEAKGGVLFIDEAYAIAPKGHDDSRGFGRDALAELVKSMEEYRDDLVVILAGYEREMKDFLDVNPGLASRIGYTFHFDDYSVDELMQIYDMKISGIGEYGLTKADGVDAALRETMGYFQGFNDFGNGRFVERMVKRTRENLAERCDKKQLSGEDAVTITLKDVPTRQQMLDIMDWKPRTAEEMLEPLVGMKKVKEQVLRLEATVGYRAAATRAGLDLPEQNLNMLFTGNPGTGKTTVARVIGSVLFNIGAVPTDHFVEVQAKDLVSGVVGGTGDAVRSYVERAMGGVLFIDEAYALIQAGAGDEALATLVKYMGDNRGRLVVMFAGYRDEMRRFVDFNPGLASRIGYRFDFEDYEPEELNEIFRRKAEKAGLHLGEGALEKSLDTFRFFHSVRDFGNGRFVDQVLQEAIAKRAARYTGGQGGLAVISKDDIPTIDEMARTSSAEVRMPSDMGSEDAIRRVALHEMGHAVVGLANTGGTDIAKVTVEQEGNGFLGYVRYKRRAVPQLTRAMVRGEIARRLGGMAAEELVLGDYSEGNYADLGQATRLAFRYVALNGMSEAGLVQYYETERDQPTRMADLPQPVLDEMNRVMAGCLETAKKAINDHREAYDALVEALVQGKTISGEEVVKIWNEHEKAGE